MRMRLVQHVRTNEKNFRGMKMMFFYFVMTDDGQTKIRRDGVFVESNVMI